MSKDEIYNALCRVFFAEEVRLSDIVHHLEYFIWQHGSTPERQVELIQAQARLDYFKSYMLDVLKFLKYYDR